MKLAARVGRIVPSPTLSITATAKSMAAQGIDVIDFASGEPDFDTPEPVKAAAEAAIRAGFTKYTPSSGIDELRGAIVDKLKEEQGLHYDKSQILVSCGAKHSLYNTLSASPETVAGIEPASVIAPLPQPVDAAGAQPETEETLTDRVSAGSEEPSCAPETYLQEAPYWIFHQSTQPEDSSEPRQGDYQVAQGSMTSQGTGGTAMNAVEIHASGNPGGENPSSQDPETVARQIVSGNENALAWNEKGNTHFKRGAFEDANNAYNKAIQLDPAFGWPYGNLALSYLSHGRPAEAILLYQKSIALLTSDSTDAGSPAIRPHSASGSTIRLTMRRTFFMASAYTGVRHVPDPGGPRGDPDGLTGREVARKTGPCGLRRRRTMEMKKMTGGNLRAIGYDERRRALVVELTSGTFEYDGVSADTWRRMLTASSPWSFFRDNIDEEYPAKRIR